MNGRWTSVVALVSALVVATATTASAGGAFDGEGKDDTFIVKAREGFATERAWLAASQDPALRLTEFMRAMFCGASSGQPSTQANGDCTKDIDPTQVIDCGGAEPLRPLWRRDRVSPAAPWSPWLLVNDWACPVDVLPAFTAEDFRRLPLAPAQVTVQPAASTVLINIPTITMAAAPQQNLATDLLGYPVEVQATATSYSWDYGDGSAALVTTSPGHAYPNHDVHHSYARPGTYTITLTTTWSGQYRIAGSTAWLDVDGTATTVTTIPPITAVERRTALVAEPCTPATC